MKIQIVPLYISFLILFVSAHLGCGELDPGTVEPDKRIDVEYIDYTLTDDETWESVNTYVVNGMLLIPPTITLEILPGTVVKFGQDAHVVVRGMLKVGTPFSQIGLDDSVNLTSNNTTPDSGDWRGILFDHTHDVHSYLRGTVIEFAEIALDIKTASPSIVDSTLRYNDIAVALDGSNAVIGHNAFVENEIGVSTIGRQTRPRIEKNYFLNNESGIVCENVQSIIQNNNFERNDFSLRLQVKFDLAIPDNWWGSTSKAIIDETILDSVDSNLISKPVGTVDYNPIAEIQFSDAGPRE